jgi:hypothetical protein
MADAEAGQVENDVHARKHFGHALTIADICDHQLHAVARTLAQILPFPIDEVINDDDLAVLVHQLANQL